MEEGETTGVLRNSRTSENLCSVSVGGDTHARGGNKVNSRWIDTSKKETKSLKQTIYYTISYDIPTVLLKTEEFVIREMKGWSFENSPNRLQVNDFL